MTHISTREALRLAALAVVAIAPAILSQSPASGQEIVSAPAPMTDAQAAVVDQARGFIRKWLAGNNIPGVSVAVGVNGRIVWAEGFGWADLEQQVPVTQITRFRIGSVSKPLTAAAAGLLYERGALDLDAPVQTYVPSFPEKEWPITTRQLMGHTAGIRHYRNNAEGYSAAHFETVTDALSMFANDPLLFEPGSRYSYSSFGFNLVSAVVEGASRRSFLEFMRTEVFAPVGLRDTVADEVFTVTPHRARFYERDADGRLRNAAYVDQSNKWGSGGFLSTPSDLVRFGQAMIDDELLQRQTRAMFWTPTRTASGEEHASGMGWALQNAGGMRLVGHPGGSVGGGTDFLMIPDQRIVVAVMANVSDAPLSPVLVNLIRMFLPAPR
jgi:CubicO group peptidase (beta-lactamase class C family)